MAEIGICKKEDIALSVLCTVIGHRPQAGWIITDGGWMAMSRDRGTQKQPHDYGYGLVCDIAGSPIESLVFNEANQEHGVLTWRGDTSVDIEQRFPIGSQIRVVPNHACATGAQHAAYQVLPIDGNLLATWSRFSGW
jgi:D-serine deaminase-like pyridoxal phosphate-dependent protein